MKSAVTTKARKSKIRVAPNSTSRVSTPAPLEGYEACKGEVAVCMGRFFVRYFTRLYHEFDGDLALIIVLGEIGHHNTCQFFAAKNPMGNRKLAFGDRAEVWKQLVPCNAFSLSAATGIPRETVRRKIATLVKRGWIKRNDRGEVFIVPAVGEHFMPDFNAQVLREILALSDELSSLLAKGRRATPDSAQEPSTQAHHEHPTGMD